MKTGGCSGFVDMASCCICIVVFGICVALTSGVLIQKVSECPINNKAYNDAVVRCQNLNYFYHCIKSSDGTLVKVCLSNFQWIEKGKCPVLHVSSEQFEEMNCQEMTRCPKESYKSYEVYKYPICLRYTKTSTQRSTTLKYTTDITTAIFTTSRSDIENDYSEQNMSNHKDLIYPSFLGIILPLISFPFIILLLRLCGKKGERGIPPGRSFSSINHLTDEDGEAEVLLPRNATENETKENLTIEYKQETCSSWNASKESVCSAKDNTKSSVPEKEDNDPRTAGRIGGNEDQTTETEVIPIAKENDLIQEKNDKESNTGQSPSPKENEENTSLQSAVINKAPTSTDSNNSINEEKYEEDEHNFETPPQQYSNDAKDNEEHTASSSLSENSNHEVNDIVRE